MVIAGLFVFPIFACRTPQGRHGNDILYGTSLAGIISAGDGCGRGAACAMTARSASVWRRPLYGGRQRGSHRHTPVSIPSSLWLVTDCLPLVCGCNWLDAGSGNDIVYSGIGHNTIYSGTGNTTIYGAGGSSYITLESGNDVAILQGGHNTVVGGSGGNDLIASNVSRALETGGADNDIFCNLMAARTRPPRLFRLLTGIPYCLEMALPLL